MFSPIRTALIASTMLAGSIQADDVSDANDLLCAVLEVTKCLDVAGCEQVLPEDLNIPQFLRIDAKAGSMSTTPASGQNRETKAQSVTRSDGKLVLQGVETGRAYSLFIEEASGLASFASVSDGQIVTVFAACTPASNP